MELRENNSAGQKANISIVKRFLCRPLFTDFKRIDKGYTFRNKYNSLLLSIQASSVYSLMCYSAELGHLRLPAREQPFARTGKPGKEFDILFWNEHISMRVEMYGCQGNL